MESSTIATIEAESHTLPVKIWELIISNLVDPFDNNPYVYDEYDTPPDDALQPLSLVSKTFLSITNQLKQTLTSRGHLTVDTCRALFARFPNLVRLVVNGSKMDWILRELTSFQLPLVILVLNHNDKLPSLSASPMETRSTLRSLALMDIVNLTEDDMSAIGDLFPNLEELNVTNHWLSAETYVTDEGIDKLVSKINGLKRLNLKGNKRVTNKSFFSVRKYCPDIEDVNLYDCPNVTPNVKKLAKRQDWGHKWMVVDCDLCNGDGCFDCVVSEGDRDVATLAMAMKWLKWRTNSDATGELGGPAT